MLVRGHKVKQGCVRCAFLSKNGKGMHLDIVVYNGNLSTTQTWVMFPLSIVGKCAPLYLSNQLEYLWLVILDRNTQFLLLFFSKILCPYAFHTSVSYISRRSLFQVMHLPVFSIGLEFELQSVGSSIIARGLRC